MASLPATQTATRGTYFTKSWFGVKPDPIRVSPSLITQVAEGRCVYVIVLGVQPPILTLILSFDPLVVYDQTLSILHGVPSFWELILLYYLANSKESINI